MKIMKTHFHMKGFALGLVLKVRVFGTRKLPIYRLPYLKHSCRFFSFPFHRPASSLVLLTGYGACRVYRKDTRMIEHLPAV